MQTILNHPINYISSMCSSSLLCLSIILFFICRTSKSNVFPPPRIHCHYYLPQSTFFYRTAHQTHTANRLNNRMCKSQFCASVTCLYIFFALEQNTTYRRCLFAFWPEKYKVQTECVYD